MNLKYFYGINYQDYEKNLCLMEIKYLLNTEAEEKYIFSNINIDSSRSAFIKYKIDIIFSGDSIEEIVEQIKINKIAYEGFKVHYIKSDYGDVSYNERLQAVNSIGYVVTGFPDIHNPKVNLAVTRVNGKWIFGEYYKNECQWKKHDKKPHSYSNAVSIMMARAIVNIAVGNNINLKVIDPCCGVGTVVIEGLDIGIDIRGVEISKAIACNARNNLEFLGYDRDLIICGDMHDITSKYDIAIVDIPYGLFSPVTLQEQKAIINTARKIANKLIIITFEDMEKEILQAGFKIIDKTSFAKNRFTRHISICE